MRGRGVNVHAEDALHVAAHATAAAATAATTPVVTAATTPVGIAGRATVAAAAVAAAAARSTSVPPGKLHPPALGPCRNDNPTLSPLACRSALGPDACMSCLEITF